LAKTGAAGFAFVLWGLVSSAAPGAQAAPAAPPAGADGAALFGQARSAWARMTYPRLVDYDVVVILLAGAARRVDRYHGQLEPASGAFRVRPFSQAEEAQPYVPHGTNVIWGLSVGVHGNQPVTAPGGGATLHLGGWIAKETPVEPFAVPELSPLYSFGVRACPGVRVADPDVSGLRTIGSVFTLSRRYRITVIGTEPLDGTAATHLALVPLVDPRADRLRDLWLDPSTFAVLQARVAGNFAGKAEASVPWVIRFATLDGATYIESETSTAPVRRGKKTFDTVQIRFDAVRGDRGSPGLAFALPPDYGNLNVVDEPPEPGADPARC
jgi:hypothetical protein